MHGPCHAQSKRLAHHSMWEFQILGLDNPTGRAGCYNEVSFLRKLEERVPSGCFLEGKPGKRPGLPMEAERRINL